MERVKEESSYILESNRKVNLTGFMKYSQRACHVSWEGGAASRGPLGSCEHLHMLSAPFSLRLQAQLSEWQRLWEGYVPSPTDTAWLHRHPHLFRVFNKQSNSMSCFYILMICTIFKCSTILNIPLFLDHVTVL